MFAFPEMLRKTFRNPPDVYNDIIIMMIMMIIIVMIMIIIIIIVVIVVIVVIIVIMMIMMIPPPSIALSSKIGVWPEAGALLVEKPAVM